MIRQLPKLPDALRLPAILLGFALLIGGCLWSAARLNLTPGDVRWAPLLANLFVIQILILIVAAVTLRLSGRVIGHPIPMRTALSTVALANFAEILPLPGGAILRGAALMKSGASLKNATSIITLTSVLTLSLFILAAAVALLLLGTREAAIVVLAAALGLVVSLWLILRQAGPGLTVRVLAIRVVTAVLSIGSVLFAFRAVSHPASLLEAALLTVSASLGSAVAIVPAGLGISEGIAAGLATLTSVPPEAAFLAIALHRVLGLVASLILIGLLPRRADPAD